MKSIHTIHLKKIKEEQNITLPNASERKDNVKTVSYVMNVMITLFLGILCSDLGTGGVKLLYQTNFTVIQAVILDYKFEWNKSRHHSQLQFS